ncbi:RNI-like protein [Thelephora ganbajun]|uniref:RNI-like protein n=1 Tax=Thelephora ganbajun TaxID=370292 RepID=A0ACB6ZA59_THEGA|nr:RNI-like protein [Thelephora ganbajun]
MVRPNNVQGPASALTDYLRETGITPATIARRARTANRPAASTSRTEAQLESSGAQNAEPANGYNSDELDEPEEAPKPKKRKLTKAAEAKLKAKAKAKTKKTKNEDDDDYEDAYTTLVKDSYKSTRPPIGSFENCAKCKQQFTVTKYTMAAIPPPGFLCHKCAKSSGADPFKKPAAPRKRKAPADKRKVVHFEELKIPSLVTLCINVITKYIDDVEALGDIGAMNMDGIAKAVCKNRSLNKTNAPLFYDVRNTSLTFYDATNLEQNALCALANLNPNLTTLRLDYCGRLDDAVIASWNTSLPNLTSIELLGPFLVRAPAWQSFFKAHPNLNSFRITQNPRFDIECMKELIKNSPMLTELRLREVGKMCDDLLEILESSSLALEYLDLSYPGNAELVGEMAVTSLVKKLGPSLKYLNLSGITSITDEFFPRCLKEHAPNLDSLTMAGLEELTDEKIGQFFLEWEKNPGLTSIDFSRNHTLSSLALNGILQHSGPQLKSLNINGWKATSNESLNMIAELATGLSKIDVGWCREVDDFALAKIQDECDSLKDLSCWGCNRVTSAARRRVSTISKVVSTCAHCC